MKYNIFIFFILWAFVGYSQAKIKIACVGNSVTEARSLPEGKDYPSILQGLLGKDYEVRNYGVSGSTLLTNGHRPYIKSEKYAASLAFKADIVIISLGLNDTDPRNWPNYSEEFIADYNALIDSYLLEGTSKKIYICINSPIFSGHKRFLSGTRDWYDLIQLEIQKVAQSRNLPLIDLREPLYRRIDLFDDFIHPSEKGTEIIAKTVFAHLYPATTPLSLDKVFGSGMVLQRSKELLLTGRGASFEEVTLSFGSNRLKSKVDSLGNWRISIPEQKAGGPYLFSISSGHDIIHLDSVYFGDVYFSSGQSNMAFELKLDTHQFNALRNKKWPAHIRYFKNKNLVQTNKVSWDSVVLERINNLEFFNGSWTGLNTGEIKNYSAISVAFLNNLSETYPDLPIGLVEMAVGGSNTESWIDRKALEQNPITAMYIHNWLTSDFIQDFCRTRATLNLKKSTVKNARHPYQPAYNYESGIYTWKDYVFKGVLWYQGESNAHNVELHEMLFPLMVESWRKTWSNKELPFYFVQLSSINRPSWPKFRNSQRLLADKLNHTYIVPSYDVGDPTDVHPTNKLPVGLRLSQSVRASLYGENRELMSPKLLKHSRGNYCITLNFENVTQFNSADKPIGFEWVSATGQVVKPNRIEINGSTISVFYTEEINPIALRYAYSPFTDANIYNENLIPIPTFKIDL